MADVPRLVEVRVSHYEREAQPYQQHPLKIVHVNPHSIVRLCRLHLETRESHGSKYHDLGKIYDGDWDLPENNPLLQESSTDRAVRQRYIEGVSWNQTPAFRVKLRRIKEGKRIDGCSSRRELERRYERLDRVAESMALEGFRLIRKTNGSLDFNQLLSVSFSRHGEPLLGTGGKHRLAIAKLLDLPSIPVLVFVRHEAWQQVLDSFFKGVHPNAKLLAAHPDLKENCGKRSSSVS